MNLAETSDLLAFIARCDNRRVDDSTVVAWHSIVGEVPLADALVAVRTHFRTSDVYLMPVHVVRGADEIDRDRRRQARELREAAERLELEAAPRTDRSREIAAGIRDMLGPGNPDALRRAEWLEADKRRDRLNAANANPDYDPTAAIAAAAEAEAP
jgi:hypothetical protein